LWQCTFNKSAGRYAIAKCEEILGIKLPQPLTDLLLEYNGLHNGCGDQFCFPIISGEVKKKDIVVWNHEDDSRQWVAPDLLTYFEWSSLGQLKF
jgi:hypothetical protein